MLALLREFLPQLSVIPLVLISVAVSVLFHRRVEAPVLRALMSAVATSSSMELRVKPAGSTNLAAAE